MQYMHISIAGRLGSGKSTVANILKNLHGFQIYSTGAIQREVALRRKVSTLELNQLMVHDQGLDHDIDAAVTKISVERKDETIIFDSRMAWNFAVNSFKVFVTVDSFVAASRVMADSRGKEEVYSDVNDAQSKLIERGRLENERFKEIYGVDNFDYANYDLVIDSTFATPDEIAGIVYDRYRDYFTGTCESSSILLSPMSLYPLARVSDMDVRALDEYMETKEYLHRCVSIVVFDGYHYVVDGLLHVLAAILNKEDFINVKLVDTAKHPVFECKESLISELQAVGISAVNDFEALGKFRYKSYPGFYC